MEIMSHGWMSKIKYFPRKLVRKVKYFWQRRTRGFDDSDTFSLDWTIAQFIVPRLKRFKEIDVAVRVEDPEWNASLDKMIKAFEIEPWCISPEDAKIQDEGLELFALHFRRLWW